MLDLLVRDGLVVDGTGAPPFRGDVAVEDGRIAAVGDLDGGARRARDRRRRPRRLPGLRRPAQPQRLHAPHRTRPPRAPSARASRPRSSATAAGRTRRSRRHSRAVHRGAAAHVRLRRPGRVGAPSASTSRSSRDAGHSQNLAWFVGHNTVRYAAGVFEPQATEEQLRLMERYVAEAMDAGALGLSTGLEFNPGRAGAHRRARPPEQGRRPLRRLLHEPRPQPRLAAAGLDRRVPDDHPRGRHAAARSPTSTSATARAPRRARGSARSTRWPRRARSRASTCSPTRRRSATGSGRWRGSCRRGCSPTAGRRRCKRLRDPRRARAAARRVRPLLALHPQGRLAPRAAPGEPAVPGARGQGRSTRSPGSDRARTSGTPTSRSSPTPGPAIESLLLIGELFTDEHLAEMISHPLFSLGVDGYTAALDSGLDGDRRAIRSASRGTCTTSPTTSASSGRCRSRRRSAR